MLLTAFFTYPKKSSESIWSHFRFLVRMNKISLLILEGKQRKTKRRTHKYIYVFFLFSPLLFTTLSSFFPDSVAYLSYDHIWFTIFNIFSVYNIVTNYCRTKLWTCTKFMCAISRVGRERTEVTLRIQMKYRTCH